MADLIEPRTLKGFRDYLPELMIPRERLLEKARQVYRSYGFAPIDTPALEYAEILLGKGGEESDKLVYRFQRPRRPRRGPALRPDGAVRPLRRPAHRQARHAVQALLTWARSGAARTPATAATASSGSATSTPSAPRPTPADIETALVIHDLIRGARLRAVRDPRQQPAGAQRSAGRARAWRSKAVPLLRSLDKLPKIGREAVAAEMAEKAGVDRRAGRARAGPGRARRARNAEILDRLERDFGGNAKAAEGIAPAARTARRGRRPPASPEERLRLDLSIARGLDYYTGTIYETFLLDLPDIGSVCSGGRYDNLAGLYTKQALPGVGASLGLDRLLAAMEELKPAAEGGDAGAGARRAVQRRPPGRLPADGPDAAGRGDRRRGLPRGEEGRASSSSTPSSAASAWR